MPTVTAFAERYIDTNVGRIDYALDPHNGTVIQSSATQFTVNYTQPTVPFFNAANQTVVYGGIGLGGFDANNVPTTGTIISYQLAFTSNSVTFMSITGLNIPVATFLSFVGTHDNAGLIAFMFAGNDTIAGHAAFINVSYGNTFDHTNYLSGHGGDDIIIGTRNRDVFDGGDGFDFVSYAYSNAISITLANPGTLQAVASQREDTLINIEGLIGSNFDDTLSGGAFADTLRGANGNDTLIGAVGDDTLEGGAGDDIMTGGLGVDTASYAGDGAVSVNLALASAQNTGGAGSDTISEIESIIGSSFADMLIGDGAANGLSGGDGDDALYGGDGADQIQGGAGADGAIMGDGVDTASMGAGADYAYGGQGTDAVSGDDGADILLGESGNDTLNGGADFDYVFGGADDDTMSGGADIDVLIGDIGNDTINGDAGNDFIYAGAGADVANGGDGLDLFVMEDGDDLVNGGDGNDFVYGGEGADTLNGDDGGDILLGEGGDDVITGGLGVDYVFLGTGADTYVIDKNAAGVNVTVLYEFTAGAGDGDVLRLLNSGWTNVGQVQANTFDTGNGYSIIVLDADSQIWVIGLLPSQLTAGDVAFI